MTDGEESMASSTCCRSACEVAATLQVTSADPVIAKASSTAGMAARSCCTAASAPWAISSVTKATTLKPAAATSTSGP